MEQVAKTPPKVNATAVFARGDDERVNGPIIDTVWPTAGRQEIPRNAPA
jgi:hypothetical protein